MPTTFSIPNRVLYVQVLTKWGEYSPDFQFILQRSPLDAGKLAGARAAAPPPLAPIWKAPPGGPGKPLLPNSQTEAARLSPDSGKKITTCYK